ncbi:MAG: hypothetical protein ACRD6W_05310, partial [Nitrososphaerales archaeon]
VALTVEDPSSPPSVVGPGSKETTEGMDAGPAYARGAHPPFLNGGNYDVLVVEALSTYLFERPEKEGIETVSALARMTRQGKSFVVTFDGALLGEKTAAFLRAVADTVVVVKTELVGERVNRMLYVPKLKDSTPMDKLIKITLDEGGVQVDTREFVG